MRTQHGHSGAQPDAFGPAGDRCQDHVSRGIHEVATVMFADIERVDTDRLRQDGLFDGVPDNDVTVHRLTGLVDTNVDSAIQSELELLEGHCLLLVDVLWKLTNSRAERACPWAIGRASSR